jgi:hypothetical protein
MSNNAIIALWHQLGSGEIDTIAEALKVSTEVVRATLYEHCSEFRTEAQVAMNTPAITDEDQQVAAEMLEIAKALARNSQSDNVKLAAAKLVIDEVKGRNDLEGPKGVPSAIEERRNAARAKLQTFQCGNRSTAITPLSSQ